MDLRIASIIGLAVAISGCERLPSDPISQTSQPTRAITASAGAHHDAIATGAANRCRGDSLSGFATTWPWSHEDKRAYAPPPGSIAIWLKVLGPSIGVSTVRELQAYYCSN